MLFATPRSTTEEQAVLERIDELRRQLRFAVAEPRRWIGLLRRNALARAIRGSNTIEGYTVTLDEAIAVAEGEDRQDSVEDETWEAVSGYRNAMTYILQLADAPDFSFSEDLLRSLHFMMTGYDLSKSPGRWRPGYIAVRNDVTGQTVYEGPDGELVPRLMKELVDQLNTEDRGLSSLIRSAMGHLNLVMIHPFRDGNGRMARALQTLILAREGILAPEFCSIEEYLGRNTQAYYDVLADVGGARWQPQRDARPWIRFCLTAHFRQARTLLNRVNESSRLWALLDARAKNIGLLERVIFALFDAASGFRVHNARYRSLSEVSLHVASRDLKALVDHGLLLAQGENRGRFYVASDALKAIRAEARTVRVPAGDPFEEVSPEGRGDPRQVPLFSTTS